MHLNTYVRMIPDVLSNLRMPERKKCKLGLLGGPGLESCSWRRELVENNQKVFQLNRNISRAATRKVFIQLPTSEGLNGE